ncbi:hypothetical protein GGR50DRAFT_528172 [Xylaria sp. CBS 124048]|nr:hypothetical protein GGR50DRAFT_528172 [Xylaria sp. CBS 124048]
MRSSLAVSPPVETLEKSNSRGCRRAALSWTVVCVYVPGGGREERERERANPIHLSTNQQGRGSQSHNAPGWCHAISWIFLLPSHGHLRATFSAALWSFDLLLSSSLLSFLLLSPFLSISISFPTYPYKYHSDTYFLLISSGLTLPFTALPPCVDIDVK